MSQLAPDLFGGETSIVESGQHSPYKRFRMYQNYRNRTEPHKTCETCVHSFMQDGGSHRYRKCELIGTSHGPGTDVSKNKVCNKWEGK